MSTTIIVELNCDGEGCSASFNAGPHERFAEWAICDAARAAGWQIRNRGRTGKRVKTDLCPDCREAAS